MTFCNIWLILDLLERNHVAGDCNTCHENGSLLNIFVYTLVKTELEKHRRVCEDNIKVVVKDNVIWTQWTGWGRLRVRILSECFQSWCSTRFPLMCHELLHRVLLQYDHHTWTCTVLPIQEGSFAWLYSTMKVVYVFVLLLSPFARAFQLWVCSR